MSTTTPRADDAAVLRAHSVTIGWALKRALAGIVILFVVVAGAAWLLHSSIDPQPDDNAESGFTTSAVAAERTSPGK